MKYRVIITPQAEGDLRAAYRYIRRHAPEATRKWLKGARKKIRTLAFYPERCPLAPESTAFDEPIRELLYGSGNRGTYRVLFTVLDKAVYVLHIRHGSMLPLTEEE
ncbi:MAG TPA: type II toxin-antitoxin system RelE/ParE family toxin [Terriglobia bacterium]|nr:type II toxin-antitoxin system RelE/ParE family toxin [Terriglobia bacterium]